MTNKPLIATVGAVLVAAVAWQTLGGPMPASVAQVAQNRVYSEETRELLLWDRLRNLKYERDRAQDDGNVALVRELERQIVMVARQIEVIREG